MSGPGLAALPEGGRVDFSALRHGRQGRLFDAMADSDVDVLVLGRPANIVFATGVRQLWTAGSRPFAPACVAVRADRRIHLLSTWDEGVPEDMPRERLFGLSWNPATVARHVSAVPGLAEARRIGADGTSAGLRRLLEGAAPEAELVDARGILHDARAEKSSDEITSIVTACALAEAGLDAMRAALRPGMTTRRLLGVHAERMGRLGAPVVPIESVAFSTADGFRTVVDDQPIEDGWAVALSPSASYAGYEGTVARTMAVGSKPTGARNALAQQCRDALEAVIDACRPGADGSTLVGAWTGAGGGDLPAPLAHGLGLGTEPPIIGMGLGRDVVLRRGIVLAVQGWMHEPGIGGWLERDVILVEGDGPCRLTRWER